MPSDFDEHEIELTCVKCDKPFVVTGKDLMRDRSPPCPFCEELNGVDVWSFHASWKRFRKLIGKD